jgi:hypothetical protein
MADTNSSPSEPPLVNGVNGVASAVLGFIAGVVLLGLIGFVTESY